MIFKRFCRKKYFFVIIITLIFAGILNIGSHGVEVKADELYEKHILIIDSNNEKYKESNDIILGIKNFFNKDEKMPTIEVEYMDSKRNDFDSYEEAFVGYVEEKYKDKKIDLIVTVDEKAFGLMKKYHQDLYSDVPVLVMGVTDIDLSDVEDKDLFTGIELNLEIKDTLEVAYNLQPDLKEVKFIMDSSYTNSTYAKLVEEAMGQYKDKFDYSIIQIETFEEIEKEITTIGEGQAAFVFPVHTNNFYNYYIPEKKLDDMMKKATGPVYSSWQIIIGRGATGGKVKNGFYYAMEVKKTFMDLLGGVSPSEIPIGKSATSKYSFNYNHLEKFHLDSDLLPEGASIVNVPNKDIVVPEEKVIPYSMIVIIILSLIIGGLIINIIRRKVAEKNVEEKKMLIKQMEEYEKLRSDFFANLSHELRTPINVINSAMQYIEMVHKNEKVEENKEKLKQYRNTIKQNSYRLLRMINNLIDITKIDAGYFESDMKNYNIVNLVEEITMSVTSLTESKEIDLIFDTDEEERIIACDGDMIERIMLNLLSNAVKFTDKDGSISVNIINKKDFVRIKVKDTGVGIPKEKKDMIFERFVQVSETLSKNKNGSGIGLSLTQSLVKIHGGDIRVESEYGKGTEFSFDLPVKILEDSEVEVYMNELHKEKVNVELSDLE